MNQSFWKKKVKETPASFPPLTRNQTVDVCIIGGGLAGLACAYELQARGKSVCILEADKVGGGETQNSSAIVTVAHDLVYDRLIKMHGYHVAAKYLQLQVNGMKKIEEIITQNKMECEYSKIDFVLFATTKKGAKEIEKERQAYKYLYYTLGSENGNELPFDFISSFTVPEQGMLNPVLFMNGLAKILKQKGVHIFEKTRVDSIPKFNTLHVNGAIVTAKHFVVATHFPYITVPGFYFIKMYQHRSHNIVYKDGLKLNKCYESAEDDGFELRPAGGGATLVGGANVRTGKYKYNSQYRIVEDFAKRIGLNGEAARFSAQDCMTHDLMPFAGSYSRGGLDNVFVVSGFNKWGFSNAFACADVVARLIDGTMQDAENIFSPQRMQFLKAPIGNLANVSEVVINLAEYVLGADCKSIARIKNGQGAIVRHKGKRLGVYKDDKGEVIAVTATCTHMGCPLKWNKDEKTWDCQCHGSRFDVRGRVICSPTVRDLTRVKLEK